MMQVDWCVMTTGAEDTCHTSAEKQASCDDDHRPDYSPYAQLTSTFADQAKFLQVMV